MERRFTNPTKRPGALNGKAIPMFLLHPDLCASLSIENSGPFDRAV
jgi:hypothetical protein